MKRLHIIFLDFDDIQNPLLGGGQARATVEVGKRLVKKGHTVTVISSKYPGYKDRKEFGIAYQHIGLGTDNIRLNNIFYILSLPLTVARLKADIIIECFTPPFSTLMSPLYTKIPVIGLPSCFDAKRFSKQYHLPFSLLEQFGLRCYRYFLPYTRFFDDKIKKYNPAAVTKIVPEGVDGSFFRIKKQKGEYILFLGRLDINQKGIDLLIKAYALLQNTLSYPLVIAGVGPDEQRIQKLVEKYKLSGKVIVMGPAYGKKKEELLSKALVVVMPSRQEGFSLFSLEALASGNLVIGFDIPGLSWVDGPFVRKVKPFHVGKLAQELAVVSRDGEHVRQWSRKARLFAKQYTWESVANHFEGFFHEVITAEEKAL